MGAKRIPNKRIKGAMILTGQTAAAVETWCKRMKAMYCAGLKPGERKTT